MGGATGLWFEMDSLLFLTKIVVGVIGDLLVGGLVCWLVGWLVG